MKAEKRKANWGPRLDKTYRAPWQLTEQLGAPPSVREVVKKMGLEKNFISRVHGDLEKLVELGQAKRLKIPTRRYVPGPVPPEAVDWDALLE